MQQNIVEKKPDTSGVLQYHRTKMQKEMIVEKLKEQGYRITKQRLMLLDIILSDDYICCKEIIYTALKREQKIGPATVYRMINLLEEIGAISRRNMYKIACGDMCSVENACMIELDDDTAIELSAKNWHKVIKAGLESCGFIHGQSIKSVSANPCACDKGV